MPTKQARISVSNEGQSETVIINRLSDKLEDAIAVMMTAMVQLMQQQSSEKTIDNWDVERIVEAKLTQALERMSGYNATDAAKLEMIRSKYDTSIVEISKKAEALNAQCDLIVAQQRLEKLEAGEYDPMTRSRY